MREDLSPADERAALEDWKHALRADVERWLESLDEIPDAGDDVEETDAPDLYSFHAQLAALATETRKSNRRTAEAFSQWSATVSGLDDQLARLREVLTLQPATSADALPRRWCLALVELIDRLRRVADAFAMTLPTPRLRWLRGDGGLRAAWETQRQALDIVVSHADALVASAGVTRIETMRQPFDPRTMIAVATTVDSRWPPQTVVDEITPGYLLHGDLLRVAQVKLVVHHE
jgi:molecular chaperone GrpE